MYLSGAGKQYEKKPAPFHEESYMKNFL